MISSNFNLEILNSQQLEQHLAASIAACSNLAIIGRRGSGKSSIARQEIKASDHLLAYANLSMLDKADLGGYCDLLSPREKADKIERFISYLLPQLYEPMIVGNKPVILLLDEVDKAERELWGPLLEIVQDKSVNGRPLPNLKMVIMTGNLIAEGGQRPCLPLLDRTEAYLLEANAHQWLEWAAHSNEIHPSVFSFIRDRGDNALLGPVDGGENYKDASPRGWHLASKILFFGERQGWSLDLLSQKIGGQIGHKLGIEFKMYLSQYKVLLPLVDLIFRGGEYLGEWKCLTPTEKLYAATIVCSQFAVQLDAASPDKPPPSLITIGRFMQGCEHENVLMGVRSQLKVPRIIRYNLDESPHWGGILAKINGIAGSL